MDEHIYVQASAPVLRMSLGSSEWAGPHRLIAHPEHQVVLQVLLSVCILLKAAIHPQPCRSVASATWRACSTRCCDAHLPTP